ncbi:MAG: hypothetical protein ACYDAQ_07530 [Mycobacteriales bacterium]
MLSPLDDYPVHQIAEVIRHVGTSDRNFYDRYYFNCHPSAPDLFLVTGLGQYPNLGVSDAFAALYRDGEQRVVRASRELGADRMDTSVGPFRVEVVEGLRRLRVVLEENEWGLEFDLRWDGAIPATLEPRHYLRLLERVVFDSVRLAQTGCWTGTIGLDGQRFDVTPDRWWGSRDRSWGVRPVGEAEPPGIRAARAPGSFFWLYAPMQFPEFSVLVILQEDEQGRRLLEEAVRVWPEDAHRAAEPLGRPDYKLSFRPGTREVAAATLRCGELEVAVEPLLPLNLGAGSGYGVEVEWRHGMYQGPLVVQGKTYDLRDPAARARLFGVVDNLARFHCEGAVGWGLFEFAAFGPHVPTGFASWDDVAG